MYKPKIDYPEWITWKGGAERALLFPGTIIRSRGTFRRGPKMQIPRSAEEAILIQIEEPEGKLDDMLHELNRFVVEVLCVEEVQQVLVRQDTLVFCYDSSKPEVYAELRRKVDDIISGWWNVHGVDSGTYELEEALLPEEEVWPDVIG